MTKFFSIGQAADILGVSPQTLRRWERDGKIAPPVRTKGKQRRYDPALLSPQLLPGSEEDSRRTIAYARVSSHDQKDDLDRQSVCWSSIVCHTDGSMK